MKLSVIIPTRNRPGLLEKALASLTRQTMAGNAFEVLVIDNGTMEQTAAVARAFVSLLPNLRYIPEPAPGLHAGRHAGMMAARSELLVFADDDIEAFPGWLPSILESFSDPAIAMVGGNNLPLFTQPPPPWLRRLWERPVAADGSRLLAPLSIIELKGGARPIRPDWIWGCNFSIRKQILLAAGGFHPDAMPRELIRLRGDGESHVSRYVAARNLPCLFHPGASVRHAVPPERMTAAYFRQRGFDQGISDSYTRLRRDPVSPPADRPGILQRASGRLWRTLGRLFDMDRDARHAMDELQAGHREGFAYHQQAYHDDEALRDWVHKPRYF